MIDTCSGNRVGDTGSLGTRADAESFYTPTITHAAFAKIHADTAAKIDTFSIIPTHLLSPYSFSVGGTMASTTLKVGATVSGTLEIWGSGESSMEVGNTILLVV